MARQVFNTSLAPDCIVGQISGDLRVKGWNLPQIAVDADPENLQILEEEDVIRLSCLGDCEIRLPQTTSLEIESVQGDARVKLVDEDLKIGVVHGSFSLRDAAGLEANIIHGDFAARNIRGDMALQQILGDADVRQAEGACKLASVLGDFYLSGASGDLHVQANGDVRVNLNHLVGRDYTIEAKGDVLCSLPNTTGLSLKLNSKTRSIKIKLPELVETVQQEQFSQVVGDGGVTLSIQAGGEISLLGQEIRWEPDSPVWTNYSEQIARQVEDQIGQQMEEISQRLNDQMERLSENLGRAGMSPEDAQRIVDQAMRASERETARAQEKMRRAQAKLERKLEDAQRKAEQKARAADRSRWIHSRHTWGQNWPAPPPPPQPPSASAVSEEERLMILRMLEQKKISIEEAEQLLQALEGNG